MKAGLYRFYLSGRLHPASGSYNACSLDASEGLCRLGIYIAFNPLDFTSSQTIILRIYD